MSANSAAFAVLIIGVVFLVFYNNTSIRTVHLTESTAGAFFKIKDGLAVAPGAGAVCQCGARTGYSSEMDRLTLCPQPTARLPGRQGKGWA